MAPLIQVGDNTYRQLLAQAESFEDTAEDVIRRLLEQMRRQTDEEDSNDRTQESRVSVGRRATPGSILPEREYWLPILGIVDAAGGAMPANDVIEAIGQRLHDRFSARDFEELHMGEIRWRNRTRFARLRMKEQGLLNGDAPRGVWEITDAGRRYLAEGGR